MVYDIIVSHHSTRDANRGLCGPAGPSMRAAPLVSRDITSQHKLRHCIAL